MQITLNKDGALSNLKTNRKNHIDTYEDTVSGWKIKLEEYSVELNAWAQQGGKKGQRPNEPQKPVNYTGEYDDLINKIDHHELNTITVEEHEFDKIINNKFNWSAGFLHTNAMYTNADQ